MLLAMDKATLISIFQNEQLRMKHIAEAARVLKEAKLQTADKKNKTSDSASMAKGGVGGGVQDTQSPSKKQTPPPSLKTSETSSDTKSQAKTPLSDAKSTYTTHTTPSPVSMASTQESAGYGGGGDSKSLSQSNRGREAQASTNVYCWGIPRDWHHDELYLLAFACGEITSIRLGPASNKPHTYAFVQFKDIQSAEKAIELLNGRQLYDRKLVVKYAHPPRSSFPRTGGSSPTGPVSNHLGPQNPAKHFNQELIPQPYMNNPMYVTNRVNPFSSRYPPLGPHGTGLTGPSVGPGSGMPGSGGASPDLAHHMHSLQIDSYQYPGQGASGKYGGGLSSSLGGGGGGGGRTQGSRQGASGPLPTQSRTNVYIGNLPETITEARLTEIFKRFGTVVSTKVIINRLTGRPLGTALVRLQTHEQAQLAIASLGGSAIEQRRVYCRFANEKRRFRDAETTEASTPSMASTSPGTYGEFPDGGIESGGV
uniref:RRM domain-containing protein n=2 Tax=Lotharella globosa TaxID=91324 RepID=A0A6V3KBE2_9EUKA|mmetsp:Transcript_9266/g.17716  ORF Transcript_9266/g.17716 Transcript_9266/m.17716 type:complete len:481 (+) Transcript_9266:746-2188(+)